MPRDYELDRLKSAEEEAFAQKQEAYQAYDALRKETDAAYAVMVSARDALDRARSEMNDAYEALQRENAAHDEVWDEYGRLRDNNNSEIESLKREADSEYQMMHDCFESASSSYEYGDKAMASEYSQEGKMHRDRLAELNDRIRELGQEVKQAREDAQWRAPKVDSSAFVAAKRAFHDAKARYESLRDEFNRLKEQRDAAKERFHAAKEAHATAKERFQARLAEVRERKTRERERILDQAGVRGFEREDAKIVKKTDGTTQVYHGGLGSGDGIGHGHTALDSSGQRTYDRGAFEAHGGQNFTEKKQKGGRWDGPYHGFVPDGDQDRPVTVAFGRGDREGQTVIADGHLTKRQFHDRRNHNHYGPDTQYGDGTERIEDKGGDRGKYSGPGH